MKPIAEKLRSNKLKSVLYLDDFLLITKNIDECKHNIGTTLNILISLGFIVNFKKCQLEPQKTCTFLGFTLDSNNYSLYLPDKKRLKILTLLKKFDILKACKIVETAQIIGVLISACPGTKYGWLHTKQLEIEKFLALKNSNDNYEAKMDVTDRMKDGIKWWINNIMTTKNPIRENAYTLEIFTDASLTGWGAVCRDEKVNGWWTTNDKKYHINILEWKAAFYGLKCFAKKLRSCEILFRVNNTTAIANLNKMGGIQNKQHSEISRKIWNWCEKRDIWVFASYVNTTENTADESSRVVFKETEWELAP